MFLCIIARGLSCKFHAKLNFLLKKMLLFKNLKTYLLYISAFYLFLLKKAINKSKGNTCIYLN